MSVIIKRTPTPKSAGEYPVPVALDGQSGAASGAFSLLSKNAGVEVIDVEE